MNRGGDRTDDLAWGIFTMHAKDGLEVRFGAFEFSLVIVVDSQPVHFASARDLSFADNRNIVLGLARNHTGVAAYAGIQINRHAPGMAFIRVLRVQGMAFRGVPLDLQPIPIFLQRFGAQKISTHQIVMELGAGKRVAVSSLLNLEA
jgi:hypothetical protein